MFLLRYCLFSLMACWCVSSSAATLYTRHGQFFSGDIRFATADDGTEQVTVVPRDGSFPLTFKLSDVAGVAYRPPLVGVLSGGTLPGEWGVRDVGTMSLAGSSAFGQGIFELRGEGIELGQKSDAFHTVWQRLPDDGQFVARLTRLSDGGGQEMAGLMIRQNLEPQSRYCFIGVSADGKPQSLFKPNTDVDATVTFGVPVKLPCWLKLVKYKDVVTASVSGEGTIAAKNAKWQFMGNLRMEGFHNSYIGMVVTSRKANELATARFDHLWLQRQGLKGEFFADIHRTDLRATRIDPNIDFQWGMGAPELTVPSAEFWARWTGTLEPASSETYSFAFNTADAAQLWIDDQKIVDTASRAHLPGAIKLLAEHRYHIRIDYYKGAHSGTLQLMWAMAGQPAQVVPSEAFVYRQDVDEALEAGRTVTPLARFVPLAKGVLLADGSFLPGTPTSLDGSKLSFRYRDKVDEEIPIDQLSRLTFQPLANAAANKIADKGAGLLTQQGDFIEGECQTIDAKELKMNSVVFGTTSFDVKTQAAAVVFRAPAGARSGWVVHTTSGGVLRGVSFQAKKDQVVLQGTIIGDLSLGWNEIIDISAVDTVVRRN